MSKVTIVNYGDDSRKKLIDGVNQLADALGGLILSEYSLLIILNGLINSNTKTANAGQTKCKNCKHLIWVFLVSQHREYTNLGLNPQIRI